MLGLRYHGMTPSDVATRVFRQTMPNQLEAIPVLQIAFEEYVAQWEDAKPLIPTLNMALDDLLNNVVQYAFPNDPTETTDTDGDGVGDLFISLFGLHSGGIVGSEASFSRPVSARALRGAPRYHRGGIAGDERVAILRTGEGVFTPEQMSRLSPAGGGITVNIENRTDAQVSARQGDDGMSIEVLIERIDERLASNVSTGRGALSNAVQNRFGLRTQAL